MSDLENAYKLNRYFYMDSNQNILKYIKYCIISFILLYIILHRKSLSALF